MMRQLFIFSDSRTGSFRSTGALFFHHNIFVFLSIFPNNIFSTSASLCIFLYHFVLWIWFCFDLFVFSSHQSSTIFDRTFNLCFECCGFFHLISKLGKILNLISEFGNIFYLISDIGNLILDLGDIFCFIHEFRNLILDLGNIFRFVYELRNIFRCIHELGNLILNLGNIFSFIHELGNIFRCIYELGNLILDLKNIFRFIHELGNWIFDLGNVFPLGHLGHHELRNIALWYSFGSRGTGILQILLSCLRGHRRVKLIIRERYFDFYWLWWFL